MAMNPMQSGGANNPIPGGVPNAGMERLEHPSFPGGLPADAWISAAAASARRFVAELKVKGSGLEAALSMTEIPAGGTPSNLPPPPPREGWRHPLPAGGVPSKEALAQNQH